MRFVFMKRLKDMLFIFSLVIGALAVSTDQARAAGATVSGTITAGGTPVPAGSFQVVFIPYAYSACNTPSGYPTGASTILPVGPNGQFTVNLPKARYRVAFKALSSAPSNALGAWYSSATTDGTSSGTDQFNCLLVDSTPITIDHTTTGTRTSFDGTLVTSTGANITSALVSLSNAATDWYMTLNGAGGQVTPDGTWEMGLGPNADVWLQVKVPATSTGQVFCGVPSGDTFTLVAALGTYPSQYCDASYKFNFGSLSRHNVRLELPVMGVISGQVTGTDGSIAKAAEVCVTAFKSGSDAANWYAQSAGSSCTNGSGQFELGVPFDSNPLNTPSLVTKYRLQFNAAGGSSPYKSRWYATSSTTDSYMTATDIAITSAAKTATANIILPIGKTISGTITTVSGTPIAGANVTAMSYSNTSIGPIGVRGVTTGEDGTYTIAGIDPGSYSIKASHPDYGAMWLGGSNSDSATKFTIQSNDSGASGKDIMFSPGYSISGSLSTSDGGSTQVCASAFRVSDTDLGWGEIAQSNCFTAPGGWSLKGIQSGNYKIRFDIRNGDYKSQFLGNTSDFSQASIVSVGQGNISGQDMVFNGTKSMVLKLVNEDAVAVTTACITAFKLDSSSFWGRTWQSMTCTNSAGTYRLRGIEPGDYVLEVTTQGTDYRPGSYTFAGKLNTTANASTVSITNSDNTIDLGVTTLYKGPKIDMTMKFGTTAVPNVCVNAILIRDDFSWGSYAGSACSGLDGKLSLKGLLEGTYRLQVNPTSEYRGGWITALGSTSSDIASASKKTVTSLNLDLSNISLTAGAKATGTVTLDGTGVANACITAVRDDGSVWGAYENTACTLNSGEFVLTGLDPAAPYRFRLSSGMGDFKQGFINDSGVIQTSISGISARTNTSLIPIGEIRVTTAPSIKGTFVSGVDKPEANICVSAIESTTQAWTASSCSAGSGKFALRGLEPNKSYKLSWWTQNKVLTNGWYKDQAGPTQTSSSSDATEITVPTGGIQNLTIRMRNGALITGTVPTGICVAAWQYSATDAASRTNADAIACGNSDNRFELRGLTPSVDYYLETFKKDGTSVVQNSPSGNTAVHTGDDVTVSAS